MESMFFIVEYHSAIDIFSSYGRIWRAVGLGCTRRTAEARHLGVTRGLVGSATETVISIEKHQIRPS